MYINNYLLVPLYVTGQAIILRPINSHLYLVHVKHSMALYNVQEVSARHRAGQKAREGDAGLTCGGA